MHDVLTKEIVFETFKIIKSTLLQLFLMFSLTFTLTLGAWKLASLNIQLKRLLTFIAIAIPCALLTSNILGYLSYSAGDLDEELKTHQLISTTLLAVSYTFLAFQLRKLSKN